MDKSNFSQLAAANPQLFNAINIAEQLYIDGYYHFIPTAIRSFCEGSLKLLLRKITPEYDSQNEQKLIELCREFEYKFSSETRAIAAVHRIRKQGNKASHYSPNSPINWAAADIRTLLKDAHDLYRLVLKDVYQDGNASKIRFSQVYVTPFSAQEEKIRLLSYRQANQELENKLTLLDTENRLLNKKLSVFETEKMTLSTEIQELNTKQQKLQQRMAMQNQQKAVIDSLVVEKSQMAAKSQELERNFDVFKRQIASLKKERQELIERYDDIISNNSVVPNIITASQKMPVPELLDKSQSSMLSILKGRHFLNAPPGAGKTTILTQRLKNALNLYADDQIVCLTFTTRAAKEMRSRANNILGERVPFIGNFHTFCLHQIRSSKTSAHRLHRFSIIDEEFVSLIMDLVVDDFNDRYHSHEPPESFTQLVVQHHSNLQDKKSRNEKLQDVGKVILDVYIDMLALDLIDKPSITSIAKERINSALPKIILSILDNITSLSKNKLSRDTTDGKALSHIIWSLHLAYRDYKFANKSMDFDDVLIFGLQELVSSGKKLEFLQIDEVQDLSQYQWEIVNSISDEQTHIFAVGDSHQSIYGFMGASVSLLNNRLKSFNFHDLTNNYRSSPEITRLLNAYRKSNFDLGPITSKTKPQSEAATMLLVSKDNLAEVSTIVSLIKKDMENPTRTIGVLLSTNAATELYSKAISEAGISFFRVSKFDLMQRAEIVDWLCLLRIFQGRDTSYDWWRMMYRICHSGQSNFTQKDAMAFVASLESIGVNPTDIVTESIQSEKNKGLLQSYKIKRFIESYDSGGVVIFDTETTGLNFITDKIIQLAAVKVNVNGITETFDKYVSLDLKGDEQLKEAFHESSKIHKITLESLAEGDPLENVLADFFDFVGDCPLVAHNLAFDETMVRMNINSIEDSSLLNRFDSIRNGILVDSLAVARQLFPKLESHKLGELLKEFNLEGVNSHNALDDVKATASLIKHMNNILRNRLTEIDSLIDSNIYRNATYTFSKHWVMIERLMRAKTADGNESELHDTLNFWIDYSYQNDMYSSGDRVTIENEVDAKLIPFLKRNNYKGLFENLMDDTKERAETLYTLKESDLISHEHKVVVSTVHRAKGLEFDSAIIPQVTDSNYPSWSPPDTSPAESEKKEAESRRLLYVAMSRPRYKLLVSYHKEYKPTANSNGYAKAISPYIQDLIDEFSWTNLKKTCKQNN